MAKHTKITPYDEIKSAIELKAGNLTLMALVPPLIEAAYDEDETYPATPLSDSGTWPIPQEISVLQGDSQIFFRDGLSGVGHAPYLKGFTRGVAVVSLMVDAAGKSTLSRAVDAVSNNVAAGDAELPPVVPWLREELHAGAKQVLAETDTMNIRDLLAFNYGLFFALCIVVGPFPTPEQEDALVYVRAVIHYYSRFGVLPT